ncbi:HAD-IA family hydrolase [Azospirillum sp. TSO22-1]|uniref:HAD-IA family hydrolase n=1 Tax=Azospirillum sp. TSO22-1 TaxID=716789 RepID=UPI000D60B010|nr:HAD-IA family hydrolase [Azospirillum sp. TSO22-1]PWC35268.1 phosphoglycolate phosphatase [Azospirillum sp. TSO22-1]
MSDTSGTPFAALVFDFDGTLIDSAPDIALALNGTLAAHGRAPVTAGRVRGMVGDGSANLLRQAFRETGAPLDEADLPAVLADYTDRYFDLPADPACLYPGVADTLKALAQAGVGLGLCTNKPERIARNVLGMIGLGGLFGAVAGGDTLPVRKPDAGPVRHVLQALGGGRAAMIGDGVNDVLSARAAGIPVALVSYGYPRGDVHGLGADLVFDRFAELPAALERLAALAP